MPHIFSKTVCLSAVEGLPSLPSPHITQLCQLHLLHLFPTNILKSSCFYYMEKSCDHLLILKSSAAPLYHIRIFLLNKCKSLPEKASGEFHFFRLTTFGSSRINRELQFEPQRSVHTPTHTPVGVVGVVYSPTLLQMQLLVLVGV